MTPIEARKVMNKEEWAQARVYSAAVALGEHITGFCIVDGPGGRIVVVDGDPLLFPSFKEASAFLAAIRTTYRTRPKKPVSVAAREAQRQWKRLALGRR